jgi:hypothetical protein
MTKVKILGVGSCVIDALIWGLRASRDLCYPGEIDIHFIMNTGVGHDQIDNNLLESSSVLIVEAAPWKQYSAPTEEELGKKSINCKTIKVPTLHFNSLWPALANDPRNKPEPNMPQGRLPFAMVSPHWSGPP